MYSSEHQSQPRSSYHECSPKHPWPGAQRLEWEQTGMRHAHYSRMKHASRTILRSWSLPFWLRGAWKVQEIEDSEGEQVGFEREGLL